MKAPITTFLLFPILLFAQASKPIGINLSSMHDYSTELVFTDAFKQCREWISYNADGTGPWGTNVELALSDNGFPLEIPYSDGVNPPQRARTLMLWDLPAGSFPVGMFRLIVEGQGRVRLRFGASGVFDTPVDTLVYADSGVAIEIESSDRDDPIADIKFILPAYTATYQDKTFTDELVDFLADFHCIRYMDWLRTNFSPVETWGQRGSASYYTQSTNRGVAWEYVIELSNLLQKDLWINIPHRADDDYIQQLALLLHEQLHPDSKIYLEYSNEVWNGAFRQHQEAAALGLALGYTGQEWERAWKYTAKRSADLFHAFEQVFTDSGRLVKLLPSQAANAWLSNQIITFFKDPLYNPHGVEADALTIAPYFAGAVANQIATEGLVSSITIPEIVSRIGQALPQAFNWMQENQAVADNHGLDLVVYEGGQHLVATGANVNVDELTQKLIAANHHPDLQGLYCEYFDRWYQQHGGLFMHFSSHGSYSKWGSWGVKETMGDVDNPKYRALQNCVFSPISSVGDLPAAAEDILIYPNPSSTGIFMVKSPAPIRSLRVYGITGQELYPRTAHTSPHECAIHLHASGIYVLVINGQAQKIIRM